MIMFRIPDGLVQDPRWLCKGNGHQMDPKIQGQVTFHQIRVKHNIVQYRPVHLNMLSKDSNKPFSVVSVSKLSHKSANKG